MVDLRKADCSEWFDLEMRFTCWMSEAWMFEAQYLQLPQIVASPMSFSLRITEKWYETVLSN